MNNIPVGDIKPNDDEDNVQVINPPSSNVPQDGDKDGRVENEDTHVSHEQMVTQAHDVDTPQPPPQVVDRRNTPLLQAHPQDLIIGSPSKGVMTRSQKLASFIEHHFFISCFEPTKVEEAFQDSDWINTMHEELNNFTRNEVWTLEERLKGARVIGTMWVFRNKQDDQGCKENGP